MIYYIAFIFVHWLCDFVLQEGDLGDDAEKDYKLSHVLYYSFTFPACSLFIWLTTESVVLDYLYFVLLAIISHAIVDYLLIPVLYYFKDRYNLKMLGLAWALDQVIHISFIILGLHLFIL